MFKKWYTWVIIISVIGVGLFFYMKEQKKKELEKGKDEESPEAK